MHGDVALYERLSLEAFQSGLAWITILRKRPAFRAAFAGFDPQAVARFDDDDVARLLADVGIVRNRAKIAATIANARAVLDLWDGGQSLDEIVWSHAPDAASIPDTSHAPGASGSPGASGPSGRVRATTFSEVPASTPESAALAAALKRRGFRFVGPTTAYATMQACGLVDDHLAGCPVAVALEQGPRPTLDR